MTAALRRHPRHAALGALVAGLALSSTPELATAAAVAAIPLLGFVARRLVLALACGALVLAGAALGDARREAIDRSDLGPFLGHAIAARGHVVRRERPTGDASRVRLRLTELRGGAAPDARRRLDEVVQVWLRGPVRALAIGDEVLVRGVLEPLASKPGARFDYALHLRRAGVHALLRADSIERTGERRGGLAGLVDAVRRRAEAGVSRGLGRELGTLARGIVLGEDEGISASMSDQFKDSGLAHLLAVSGQNVTLLALLAVPLLAALGFGRRARLAGVLALIALYVPLTGAGPSVMRAGAMGAAGTVAMLAGRPASRWYALLLAAAFTLGLDPRAWLDAGWQLSFAAVAGIFFIAPRVRALLGRLPQPLAEGASVTVAATLATAPLLAFHFERVSLVALLANMLALPAVAPIMWLGTLAAGGAQIALAPAELLNALNGFCLAYLAAIARWCAGFPGAAAPLRLGSPAALVAAYGVPVLATVAFRRARAASRRRPGRRRVGLAAALAVAVVAGAIPIALSTTPSPLAGQFRVTFLDVGQGDATLLQSKDGASALVDGGPPESDLVPRLRAAGVRSLDLVVLTHAQTDHQGGLDAVLRKLPVALLLDGGHGARDPEHRRIVRAARERGTRVATVGAGDVVRLGALTLRVLSPERTAPAVTGEDPNARALVLLASYRELDVLLPADAESDVTLGLPAPRADVLKVAHHGSRDDTLNSLLERVRPRLAVIEVGAGNRYGHPHARTLAALGASVPAVLRTDRDGDVTVLLTGDGVRVSTEK